MSTDPPAGADPAPPASPSAMNTAERLYLWLAGVFITSLLVANLIGVKLFRFEIDLGAIGEIPVEHTAGMIPFPVTFLLTDLLNEYFGKKAARRVTYLAFTMGALAFAFVALARMLPIHEGVPGTATQESFETIFGSASLMYIASLVAFLVGSLLDISLFGLFKRLTGGRFIWLRATGSTVISQLFDSFVVTFLFFMGLPMLMGGAHAPARFVFTTALTGYILKFVIAVALTPVIYAGRALIQRGLGLRPLPPE